MDTIEQFVSGTHSRGAVRMPVKSIGLREAREIAAHVDWHALAGLSEGARLHLPAVLDELDELSLAMEHHPERMRRRAFLFGIASPHRDESQAIAWAIEADALFDSLDADALARHRYASPKHGRPVSLGTYAAVAGAITSGASRNVWHGGLLDLEATPGVGPKVARMVQAILDPSHPSWTVDLWHARQLLWAADRDYCVAASVSKAGYGILEGVWLSYAARFFPGVPVFAVQWATWCVADGRFVSHRDLWADLANTEG